MTLEQISNEATRVWADKEAGTLVMEREFEAPLDLVWKAWTEPERIEQWWGPRDWQTKNTRMDVRPGGTWHYCMTGPGGMESWGLATYREIVEQQRIVYEDAFSDASGKKNAEMPVMVITNEFRERDGRTTVRSSTQFASPEALQSVLDMGVVMGASQTWDRLAEYVERM
jgi:uncharacterized protein YndB with AHSA1/START domain